MPSANTKFYNSQSEITVFTPSISNCPIHSSQSVAAIFIPINQQASQIISLQLTPYYTQTNISLMIISTPDLIPRLLACCPIMPLIMKQYDKTRYKDKIKWESNVISSVTTNRKSFNEFKCLKKIKFRAKTTP